jgi:3-deoxy-D-manno-octulosonic-acid transferase
LTSIFYNLVVRGYGLVIRTAALRNPKAAKWVRGRSGWRAALREKHAKLAYGDVIWVHCASYGEFEQGRPLIEGLKKKYPLSSIVLTFFSPSGYDAFCDWAGADLVTYLPLDTRSNARDFLEIVKPRMAVFIKYEFWLNYLRELKERNIPTYLVSAVFKPHHPFFRWYGSIFRESLRVFRHLFIQDEKSGKLLSTIGISNYSVTGDTRFDRVMEIRQNGKPVPEIERFRGDRKLIICGSTWPRDETLVIAAFKRLNRPDVKMMIVPHEVRAEFITKLEAKLAKERIACSVFTRGIEDNSQVLILDTIGMLARSYRYADCAYIGGGFNDGLHNALEPAVYGVGVTFYGGEYHRYNEVTELMGIGAARRTDDAESLAGEWERQLTAGSAKTVAESLKAYFSFRINSTDRILRAMEAGEENSRLQKS